MALAHLNEICDSGATKARNNGAASPQGRSRGDSSQETDDHKGQEADMCVKKNPDRSSDPGFKFVWCGVQDSNL